MPQGRVLPPDGVDVIVDEGCVRGEPGVSVGGGAMVGAAWVGVALTSAIGTAVSVGVDGGVKVDVRVTGAMVGGRVAGASVGVLVDG